MVSSGSKFWNTSGLNIEASIFSGIKVDSESIETLISGGIAFATPEPSQNDDKKGRQSFTLHQDVDDDWLEWQPKIVIEQ